MIIIYIADRSRIAVYQNGEAPKAHKTFRITYFKMIMWNSARVIQQKKTLNFKLDFPQFVYWKFLVCIKTTSWESLRRNEFLIL